MHTARTYVRVSREKVHESNDAMRGIDLDQKPAPRYSSIVVVVRSACLPNLYSATHLPASHAFAYIYMLTHHVRTYASSQLLSWRGGGGACVLYTTFPAATTSAGRPAGDMRVSHGDDDDDGDVFPLARTGA